MPARRICSLEHYREKRQAAQVEEAKEFVRAFRERWGRDPREEEVPEYFFLFADPDNLNPTYKGQMRLMGTLEKSVTVLREGRPYQSYEKFLEDC